MLASGKVPFSYRHLHASSGIEDAGAVDAIALRVKSFGACYDSPELHCTCGADGAAFLSYHEGSGYLIVSQYVRLKSAPIVASLDGFPERMLVRIRRISESQPNIAAA
jgi:hypothetical protein